MDEGHGLLSHASTSSCVPLAVCWVKVLCLGATLLSLQGPPVPRALQPPCKSIQPLVCPPQDQLYPAARAEAFHVLNTN